MLELFGVTFTGITLATLGAAVLSVVAASLLVAVLVQRSLTTWAHRRGLAAADVAAPVVRRYLLPVILVAALHIVLSALSLPRHVHAVVGRLLAATTLALGLYLTSQILLALLARVAQRSDAGQRVSPEVLGMARAAMLVVSLAILLDNLGVHVTALVTTLGIGSLAVALGLQDTFSNFFAGLYLKADRPLRDGDYIRLDTGQEGAVVRMGWRSTRLRTIGNNIVVVPNERLSKAVITNFSLPSPEVAFSLTVTVPYGSEIERVIGLLLRATEQARADVDGLLSEPRPIARLIPGFGDAGLSFTLTAWVHDFDQQFAAEDAIRRRLVDLFRAESIEIKKA